MELGLKHGLAVLVADCWAGAWHPALSSRQDWNPGHGVYSVSGPVMQTAQQSIVLSVPQRWLWTMTAKLPTINESSVAVTVLEDMFFEVSLNP